MRNSDIVLTSPPASGQRAGACPDRTAQYPCLRGDPLQNQILAALPFTQLRELIGDLEPLWLDAGATLIAAGDTLEAVYFPTTAIVSHVYTMADGATTEVAMIGHEGVVGMCLYPANRAITDAVVQSEGLAYRLDAQLLRHAIGQGGVLPELLIACANTLFRQIALTTVGSQHSTLEQKLSRWLLERLDRSPSATLKVTQEHIAILLGVRRESITGAARKLHDEGLICCRRGVITVDDRAALERRAGECYQRPPRTQAAAAWHM